MKLGRITILPVFVWYDLWVGAYINRKACCVYIFPVPMFGVCVILTAPVGRNPEYVTRADLVPSGLPKEPEGNPPGIARVLHQFTREQWETWKGERSSDRVSRTMLEVHREAFYGDPPSSVPEGACTFCGGPDFYGGSCTTCGRDLTTGCYDPELGPT